MWNYMGNLRALGILLAVLSTYLLKYLCKYVYLGTFLPRNKMFRGHSSRLTVQILSESWWKT
jgi:hypothetical protein